MADKIDIAYALAIKGKQHPAIEKIADAYIAHHTWASNHQIFYVSPFTGNDSFLTYDNNNTYNLFIKLYEDLNNPAAIEAGRKRRTRAMNRPPAPIRPLKYLRMQDERRGEYHVMLPKRGGKRRVPAGRNAIYF